MLDMAPVVIDAAVARDRADPCTECGRFAKLAETVHRLKKHLLDPIVGIRWRDAAEQNAMDGAPE